MPNLTLHNINCTQVNAKTWCATAQVKPANPLKGARLTSYSPLLVNVSRFDSTIKTIYKKNWHYYIPTAFLSEREIAYQQRQQQRAGVRLLLQSLLNKLAMIDDLDDSNFPYRLIKSQYYVCFSHTGAHRRNGTTRHKNHVPTNPEFSNNKVAVIISANRPVGIDIETNNVNWPVVQRYYHHNEKAILPTLPMYQRDIAAKLLWQIKESVIKVSQFTLAQGLGVDYSHLIVDLINSGDEKSAITIIYDTKYNHHIAVLNSQQVVIVY